MIRSTLSATLVAASLALVPAPLVLAQEAAPEEPAQPCECQCAACQEKHGKTKKAQAAAVQTTTIESKVVGDSRIETISVASDPAPLGPAKATQEPNGPTKPARKSGGRGVLGVQIGSSADGVAVTQVMEGLAADAAGIQAGDVIFSIADRTVLDLDELREQMAKFKGGDVVSVGVIRNERPLTLTVTLGTDAQVARSTRPAVPMIAQIVPSPADPLVEDDFLEPLEEFATEDAPGFDDFGDEVVVEEFEIELPTAAPPVAPSTGVGEAPAPPRFATPRPAPLPAPAARPRVEYVEIETEVRRERRPVVIGQSNDDLRRQIEEMRAEIAELRAQIDEMKRELDRRSLR